MKKAAVILIVLMFIGLSLASCQKAKEPEKEVQKTEEKQQPSETKTEVQAGKEEPSTAKPEPKKEKETTAKIIPSPLTEKEQEEFEKFGGNFGDSSKFESEQEAVKYLRILVKGNHKTIRWYQGNQGWPPGTKGFPRDDKDNRRIYGSDIATALARINMKTNRQGFNLAVEVLKTKSEYPEAMAAAAWALKFAHDPSVIPLLRETAKNSALSVRREAAGSLLSLGDADSALPVLDELIEKEGSTGAMHYLFREPGKIIDERGYKIVEKALRNPRAEVKIAALKLLLEANRIPKGIAEGMALDVLNNFKSMKEYGIAFDPNETYKIIPAPGSKEIDVEKAKEQRGSDFRACETAISILIKLKSKKAIPVLEKLSKHPDASYLKNHADEAIGILYKQ